MVSLNPADTQIVRITPEEQLALLQHCNNINEDTRQMLFSAKDGTLTLTVQECTDLRYAIGIELDRVRNTEAADTLGSIYNKLCTNPVTRKIGMQLNEMSFSDMDQMQAAADQLMHNHNNTPDPALGGLTPMQTHKLLYSEWDKPDCPMKLNQELTYDDVKNSPLYHNARALLEDLLQRQNEPTATAKGNLCRKVVRAAMKTFIIDNYFAKTIMQVSKTLNEQEVATVWTARIICQLAGLIRKNKNKFLVTKKGQKLLAIDNAGKLYHLLFCTYMQKFNIGFHDRLPDLNDLQYAMAYTIYHLKHLAKEQVTFDEIYRKITIPSILKELDRCSTKFIRTSWIIRYRLIEPLEFAGLLDCKREKVDLLPKIVSLKTSPLFDKFVKFGF